MRTDTSFGAELHAEGTTFRLWAPAANTVDVMLDRHIGTFRKDYDDLAGRVKRLEQLVLK